MVGFNNANFIKIFTIILLLFIFLPAFYIPSTKIPIYDISIGILMFFFILFFPKDAINKILFILKYKHVKILLFFIFWVILIDTIFLICGHYSLAYYIYATFLLFFYNNILWYLSPLFVCPKIFSIKTLIKMLYFGIYIVCIYGLFIYICQFLNISIADAIQKILNNRYTETTHGIRLRSFFEEPGHMGLFICINLPFICTLSRSKFKIFDNSIIDKFIRYTYMPLLCITILFVLSPIWFIIFPIILCAYYFKEITQFVIKYYINIIVTISILIFLFIGNIQLSDIDTSETFLNRIVQTKNTITDWSKFVQTEPSLANRILSYYFRIKTFVNNPITGVGYKNTEYKVRSFVYNETLDFTAEMEGKIIERSTTDGYITINGSILWILLSDTGLIGTILFFLFIIYSIRKLNRIYKHMPNCIEKSFALAVRNFYVTLLCLSIYETNVNTVYYWFMYGLTNVFLYNLKPVKNLKLNKEANVKTINN